MKVAVDTNVLLRLLVRDDEVQTRSAAAEVEDAETVVLPTLALCETAWVLGRTYRFDRASIAEAIRALITFPNVEYDKDEVEAGLAVLDLGGDFADGVIAEQGNSRGAATLLTFDRKAVARLSAIGVNTRLVRNQ